MVALVVKNPPASAGDVTDMGSIPGLVRYPEEGSANPLQYSYLENARDGVAKSRTRLSMHMHIKK